jgi:hypothetical protein
MSDIEERLKNIERDIAWIVSYLMEKDEPIQQPRKVPEFEKVSVCSLCDMEWKGTMSYSCSNMSCPMQVKASYSQTISSGGNYQSYNQPTFDIESLDPDQRSWYYDGFGVQRKKDWE